MDGEPFQIRGHGYQTRTFCYVTDAIEGFLRVLLSGIPSERYNIGIPSPEISIKELAKEIRKPLGNKPEEFDIVDYYVTYSADEPNRRCPDISKAATQLRYGPRIGLDGGLERFFGWAGDFINNKNLCA